MVASIQGLGRVGNRMKPQKNSCDFNFPSRSWFRGTRAYLARQPRACRWPLFCTGRNCASICPRRFPKGYRDSRHVLGGGAHLQHLGGRPLVDHHVAPRDRRGGWERRFAQEIEGTSPASSKPRCPMRPWCGCCVDRARETRFEGGMRRAVGAGRIARLGSQVRWRTEGSRPLPVMVPGLVRAQHVHAAEVLDRGQALDD